MPSETLSNTTRPVLVLCDAKAIADDPKLRLPTRRDWKRIGEFERGEYPLPWPSMAALSCAMAAYNDLKSRDYVVVDTEYGIDDKRMYQCGLYAPGSQVWIWDEEHPDAIRRERLLRLVREIAATTRIVIHHAPADLPALRLDYDACKNVEDSVLAHATLWPEWKHNLRFLISLHGKHERVKHLGPGSWEYLRGDVVETANVWDAIEADFKADRQSKFVYDTFMKPLTPVIVDVHRRGLRVNQAEVERKAVEYDAKIEAAQRLAEAYAGYPINLDGPQLGTYLDKVEGFFDERKYKKTESGRPKLDKDAVAALCDSYLPRSDDEELTLSNALDRIDRGAHPLLEARRFYIEARQRRSLFIEPLLGRDRVYPEFLVFAQATGRWSIIRPNLAQFTHDLRILVQPDDGEAIVEFDFDAIELRIVAWLSGDVEMIEAFDHGYDLHTINMCRLFGYPLPSNLRNPHTSKEDEEWRRAIGFEGKDDVRRVFMKRFVFRLCYGGRPETAPTIPGADLLAKFGMTKTSLISASKTWLKQHPKLVSLWASLENDCLRKGMTRTVNGRRRVYFETDLRRRVREAYNQPIQGTVVDAMNAAVIDFWRLTKDVGGHLFYTCHDSVKWALPKDKIDEYLPRMKDAVEGRVWKFNGVNRKFTATWHIREE